MDKVFLDFSVRKLRQLADRIGTCVGSLDESRLWARAGEEQNAAGNLLLHLAGNVCQWIGSAVGGRPDDRVREAEFAARQGASKQELVDRLQAAVDEAAAIMESLPPGRLAERINVQGYDVTVMEAIYHVVEHFAQHTGQIILLTKLYTGRGMDFYSHLGTGAAHGRRTP
jgi:uncharacterized damage-inducible protein DinB